jgi:hypothetical protein
MEQRKGIAFSSINIICSISSKKQEIGSNGSTSLMFFVDKAPAEFQPNKNVLKLQEAKALASNQTNNSLFPKENQILPSLGCSYSSDWRTVKLFISSTFGIIAILYFLL